MDLSTKHPEVCLALGAAFVGGFGDAAGFVLAKSFTGHITGNLVLAAISAATLEWQVTLVRLGAVASFLAGVLLCLALPRVLSSRPAGFSFPSGALGVEAILIVGGYWALAHHPDAGAGIFVVCLSLALGLQNGAIRRIGNLGVHTTYLTGMITGLLVAQTERPRLQPAAPAADSAALRAQVVLGICVMFFLGAAIAAVLTHRFGAAGILLILPILAVLALAGARAASAPRPASSTAY